MSPDPDAVDAICREILRVDELHHASQDQKGDAAFWARLTWDGEIIGLRKALCALFGWPMEEAAKEGKADQYVEEWMADHPDSAGPVRPDEELVDAAGHDFQWDDGRVVQRCTRCTLPHPRWAGGPCPGHPLPPGDYV